MEMINGITHNNKGKDILEFSKEELSKANEVYVCPSFACDLKCPHCTLKNLPYKKDIDAILNDIKIFKEHNSPKLLFDIFGGEPFLNDVEVLSKIRNAIGDTEFYISTNLLNLDIEKHKDILKDITWINVSWNNIRLSKEQYKIWLNNLYLLHQNNIKVNGMITLTNDLITQIQPNVFLNMLKEWNFYSLDLEYFIGKDYNDSDLIDKWLLDLYKRWNIQTKFNIVEQIKKAIKFKTKYKNCSNHFTILPNGKIHKGCPYFEKEVIKEKCFLCEYFQFCDGGCKLETKCTFPKQLYRYILNND